jgi:carboxyl-terminal processing protease
MIDLMGSAAKHNNPTLNTGDMVLSIDKKPAAMLAPDAALDLVLGQAGTIVELEIYQSGMQWTVKLLRQATFLPSVQAEMRTDNVGYLQISSFQESTVREVDDALANELSKAKSLILDLRGNSGGLFESAIEVARRFIANGIITFTHNTDPKLNTVYHARNPNALDLPLIVLIDGDTASAAEVLAGALKDHKRGRLVGQTTFGKGCTQCILKLPAEGNVPTGGLRLTVARFFSPDGLPYTGRGVVPDRFATTEQQYAAQVEALLEKK